jgi:hypothetical protein
MLPSLRKEWKGYGRANRLGESTILTTDASTPITLDSVAQHLRNGSVKRALSALDDLLNRRKTDTDRWPQFKQFCAAHQLRELLQQDPLTFRAFTKPRGYAGDAVMMDYVYGLGQAVEAESHATRLGRAIFRFTCERPASRAVRYRRKLIANLIDGTAAEGAARILAIASGHLREVELSSAVREKRLEEFVAFDQDAASLEVVSREYAQLGVTAMQGSARQILSGKVELGCFDFVYAAGLFDYLTHPAARSLTGRMFTMLRPGGRLLVPNFLPGVRDIGYMEAFMDWHLIYRDHGMMRALAESLPAREIADCKLFNDSDDAIAFLLISKAY